MATPPARDARPAPPARSGQPWTAEDYETAVTAIRRGDSTAEMAERLGRRETTLLQRLRRMLPVDERNCPPHLVVGRLRDLLDDLGYDWRQAMLKDSPPRPIHQPPAIVRSGVDGLADDELVAITYGLLRSDCPQRALMEQVRECLVERGLARLLVQMRAVALSFIADVRVRDWELEEAAENWLQATPGWEHVGLDRYSRYAPAHSSPRRWDHVVDDDLERRYWEQEPPDFYSEHDPEPC